MTPEAIIFDTSNTVILCASARLTQGIRQWVNNRYQQQGHTQWQAPQVYPLQDWLFQLTEQAILSGCIDIAKAPVGMLSSSQEAVLWEQAIQHCLRQHDAIDLFNTNGLASAAMEANRYLIEWNISIDMANASEETRHFMQWRQQFQQLCKQSGYLEAVRYQVWQLEQLAQHAMPLPAQIQLAGFDRIHPHLQRLIDTLQASGVSVQPFDNRVMAQCKQRMAFAECLDEMRAAVHWAKQRLSANPQARLAIVVPDLQAVRDTLENLLDDSFHPASLHPANAEMPRCYEFSLGLPLIRWPLVDSALRLLQLAFQHMPIAQTELSALLSDVYWSQALFEADARAALDAEMRRQLPLQVKFTSFVRFIARHQQADYPIHSPALLEDLNALLTSARLPAKQLPSAWSVSFRALLTASHWPGERSLSSHEYQCQQSFYKAIAQLSTLDTWLGAISAMTAILRLNQLCQTQIFQPQTVHTPNILIMGMLEASAQPLDGVWVMGMNDHVWPPLSGLNALIPAELQRQAGTPNASSEIQIAFASQIHQRLLGAAYQVIFSYAQKEGDRLLRMSPLIQDIDEISASVGIATLAETLATSQPHSWQWLDDDLAPSVHDGEHVSGGTALLRAQAICPAWAFYQYRLKARLLETPHNGLDAMQRGDLIHRVMSLFWMQQPTLDWMDMDVERLKMQLNTIAEQVMSAFNAEFSQPFSEVFCQIEAERLSKLALTWLWQVERERPQAFTVTAIEKEFKLLIEGIQVKLIIDRVDTLEDGRLVVIDYKTGSAPDFKNWASERITEPQLPIYAAFVLQNDEVAAVCFGKLRLADGGFAGVAAEDDILPAILAFNHEKNKVFNPTQFPNWAAVRQHWRTQITQTALALKAGKAAVVFASEQELSFCDVLPLLRLPERQLQFEQGLSRIHDA